MGIGLEKPRLWLKLLRRARKKLARLEQADVILLCRAKSGSTWLRVMLGRLFHLRYGTPETEIVTFNNLKRLDPRIPSLFTTNDNIRGVGKKQPDLDGYLASKKIILLFRDPRDIAVSMYFHFSKRSTAVERTLLLIPEDLQKTPIFDFVMDETIGMPPILEFMNRWEKEIERYQHLRISYEEMRAHPRSVLRRVADFLGGDFTDEQIEQAVEFAAFDNLKDMEGQQRFGTGKLAPGDPGDPDSFKVRRGKVGGWRDYFGPEECEAIDKMVRERLSPAFDYHTREGTEGGERAHG